MIGPSTEFREQIFASLQELSSEDELNSLLDDVSAAVEQDLAEPSDEVDADDLLASVEAWTGLLSHVVAYYYAPASPWPYRRGGWDKSIVARLRKTALLLHGPMQTVRNATGATEFSISIGFPWGVSVGLSW